MQSENGISLTTNTELKQCAKYKHMEIEGKIGFPLPFKALQ